MNTFKYIFICLFFLKMIHANDIAIPFIPLGHSKSVNAIDSNNTILITGSEDSTVKVWDLKQKKLIKTFRKHKLPVKYVKLIPKTDLVLSIGFGSFEQENTHLYLWNIKTKKVFKEYKLPVKGFDPVALIPNTTLLMMATVRQTIILDLKNGREHNATYYFPDYYQGSKFIKTNQSEKKILLDVGYPKKKLGFYDLNGTLEQTIPYSEPLCTVALSSDLKYIAAFFNNKKINIYDTKNAKLLTTIETKKGCRNDNLEFSPSGNSIVLASGYDVEIWDINSSEKTYTAYHSGQVSTNSFTFLDDANYAIGDISGSVYYVNLNEKKEVSFNTYSGIISKVAFRNDGTKIYASNNQDHSTNRARREYFSILNYKTKKEIKLFHSKHEDIITASYLSSNHFFTAHFNGSIGIWDINSKTKLKEKKVYDESIEYIDISQDEKMIAVASNTGKINVLDTHSLNKLFEFNDHQEFSQELRFSPDGKYLLYMSSHNFKVWETSNWKLKLNEKIKVNSSHDIKFKSNNTVLLVDNPKKIFEYDIETKKKTILFDIEKFLKENHLWEEYDSLKYYRFSHNGNKLLMTIKGQTFVLDIKLKQSIKIETPFNTDGYLSKKFYFNFDDSSIASVDHSTLYLWNTKTGANEHIYKLYTFDPDDMFASAPYDDIEVSFSSNKYLVSSNTPKTDFPPFTVDAISIWDIKESKMVQSLKARRYTTGINDFALDANKTLSGSSAELTLFDSNGSMVEQKKYQKLSSKITLKGNDRIPIKKVAILSDRYMAMTGEKIVLIDKMSLKILKTIEPLNGHFASATVSSDNQEIITTNYDINKAMSGDYNDSLVVYNSNTGEVIVKMSSYGANAVAYSDDKTLFAMGVFPRPIIINLEKKTSVLLKEHSNLINAIKINPDSSLVVTGSYDNKIQLFDAHSGDLIYTFEGHEGSVNSLAFHPTKPFLISGSSDGTVKYWDIKKKKLIATFISFEDKWITLTPEGFFNASSDAAQKLNILYDDMTIGSMRNLFDIFFRPDLVKLKLMGEDISQYTKDINLKTIIANKPPVIEIEKVDNYTDQEKVKLTFNVNEQDGGGVGLIRVYQEGKLIQTIGEGKVNKQSANIDTIIAQEKLDSTLKENQKTYMASLRASKSINNDVNMSIEDIVAEVETSDVVNKSGTYDLEIELKSGKNEISIEAFNKTNTVTSYRENITVNANIPKQKPKLYAIIAGVNEFETNNKKYRLQYSQNDAQALKDAVEQRMKTVFNDVEVIYLTGKEVTKDNILKAAQEISKKAKLDDTVLFYISTHGRAASGKLYLVPYNNKLFKNWINFEQTFKAVQSIKALNQIFIIDACESGKANDIVSSVYDSRASVLAKSSGVHVLLATTKGTYAFEHPDKNIKNGVFTYKILQAMKNKQTDANKDKFISILELSKKLKEPISNTDYQYPVIRNVGKDVRLEKVLQ